MTTRYISTAIPYVNAPPHIGFALELVIADVLARDARSRGDTFFLSGTDENSLKNALAAAQLGIATEDLVDRNAAEFARLKDVLNVSYDDFLRTSSDPRHGPAVHRLWNACVASGDVYAGEYAGLYCVGCEQFYLDSELVGGVCPEHRVAPEAVAERNWFFRLGRYQDEIVRLVARDELRIRPAHRKREVLAFLEEPLRDLSISRSVERARGWGIPVPGDSAQIVYVWFDALANYVSALDYATSGARLERYWSRADRVSHVIGKGVTRFHAVYWPAILLSAGLRPPTELLVHGYVTVDGEKIGKSLGNTIAPAAACSELGVDALRYYLLRHVGTHRDGDFSWQRLREVYAGELANGLGNLLARATALVRRHGVPEPRPSRLAAGLEDEVRSYISEFALHRGLDAIWAVVAAANAHVNETEPWTLAKRGEHEALAAVLAELYAALRSIGAALAPFLPDTSTRLLDALAGSCAVQLFPRVRPPA